ncbi:MAG: zinc ribbon domain-containing protein [Desulfobacteraceae bacterium]|jgi:hypothetical protein
MKIYDYECPQCGKFKQNTLVNEKEHIFCECGTLMTRLMCAPKILTTIIPTYPGSQRRKAGYQHKHVNRPATKTQVGVGGGVTKRDI